MAASRGKQCSGHHSRRACPRQANGPSYMTEMSQLWKLLLTQFLFLFLEGLSNQWDMRGAGSATVRTASWLTGTPEGRHRYNVAHTDPHWIFLHRPGHDGPYNATECRGSCKSHAASPRRSGNVRGRQRTAHTQPNEGDADVLGNRAMTRWRLRATPEQPWWLQAAEENRNMKGHAVFPMAKMVTELQVLLGTMRPNGSGVLWPRAPASHMKQREPHG